MPTLNTCMRGDDDYANVDDNGGGDGVGHGVAHREGDYRGSVRAHMLEAWWPWRCVRVGGRWR